MTTDKHNEGDTLLRLAANKRRAPKRMPADFSQKVMSRIKNEPQPRRTNHFTRRIMYAVGAVAASVVIAVVGWSVEQKINSEINGSADNYSEMMYAQMVRAHQTGEEMEYSYESVVKSVRSHGERMMEEMNINRNY